MREKQFKAYKEQAAAIREERRKEREKHLKGQDPANPQAAPPHLGSAKTHRKRRQQARREKRKRGEETWHVAAPENPGDTLFKFADGAVMEGLGGQYVPRRR